MMTIQTYDTTTESIRELKHPTLNEIPIGWREELVRNNDASSSNKYVTVFINRPRHSSGQTLLKYAGTWVGEDLGECLKKVYESRGEVKF